MTTKNPTRVVTGLVRFSYVNIFEPKEINGSDPKYSISLIIPEDDAETIKKIEDATKAALEAGKAKFGGRVPPLKALKLPLRDGDERPEDPAYKGAKFVNANATTKIPPIVVDRFRQPIEPENADQFYSGCYGFASIEFYAFSVNGNKGVACALRGVQKVKDGEPLGAVNDSLDDFQAIDSPADDDDLLA